MEERPAVFENDRAGEPLFQLRRRRLARLALAFRRGVGGFAGLGFRLDFGGQRVVGVRPVGEFFHPLGFQYRLGVAAVVVGVAQLQPRRDQPLWSP